MADDVHNRSIRYFKRKLRFSDLSDTWPNILWREYHYTNDAEYAAHLKKVAAGKAHAAAQSRPTATEVEVALRQGCRRDTDVKDVWQRRLQRLYKSKHKRISVEDWIAWLDDDHWLERFVARHVLVYRGGEAVKPLSRFARSNVGDTKDTAVWLLQSISTDTQWRLAPAKDTLLCPECLTRCDELWIDLPWQRDITYCGCRSCGQSRRFIDCPHQIVAVLDNTWLEPVVQEEALRVNWFGHQNPFDFDCIEIIQATDEEIERFTMRMGNDTDPVRKPQLGQIPYTIGPECHPSNNTLRILDKMFGQIEQATHE
jgi:hypothetical protein